MRVLFIYSNTLTDLLPAPPIGLSYVASATADAGHEVKVMDLLMARDRDPDLRRILERFKPQVIGLSVRNIDNLVHQRLESNLDALVKQLKVIRSASDAAVVLGGPAISILGANTLKTLAADFAIIGEGEESFPRFLRELEGARRFSRVPGLCIREGERIVCVPPQAPARFGSSGMERWVDWRPYQRRGATWSIQAKRGCPLQCTYCVYGAVEGQCIRKRAPEDIVDEIERVAKTVNPRCFEFVDSTFNLPPSHAKAVCEEIIRRGLKVRLTTMGFNPLGASKELFSLMKRAGFNSLMITPESASDIILENMRKGFDAAHVHRCAELARRAGLASMWFFMLGAPGETRKTVEQTVSFVERHLNWRRCLAMFTTGIRILPRTELARQSEASGYLRPGQDLTRPVFYFSPHVSEAWMLRRVSQAIAHLPNIVHAAEDSHPRSRAITDRVHRLYYHLGVSPPYWRFLPALLRLPPLPRLRALAAARNRA